MDDFLNDAAKQAGQLLVGRSKPILSPIGRVDGRLVRQHQQAVVEELKATYDHALDVMQRMSLIDALQSRVILTAEIRYGFPDSPTFTSPNSFTHQMDDWAVTIPLGDKPRRGTIDHMFFRANKPPTGERFMAVYPNFLNFQLWWIQNLDGPIHQSRCAVQRAGLAQLAKPITSGYGLGGSA